MLEPGNLLTDLASEKTGATSVQIGKKKKANVVKEILKRGE